jgi:hypothetical protein
MRPKVVSAISSGVSSQAFSHSWTVEKNLTVEPFDFWADAREIDVERHLRTMCCPSAQFMWDNRLLAPRIDWNTSADHTLIMGFLLGFRVVRAFLFFRRDQMLYECPFCRCVFVRPLAYRDLDHGAHGILTLDRLPQLPEGMLPMQVPRRYLEQALAETKKRNKAGWPPKD